MKVLYIAHSAEMQGAGFALLNILQGMVERNINVYVVVPREGRLTVILKDMGIPFLIIPFFNAIYPRFDNTIRSFLLFIPRLFRTLLYNKLAEKRLHVFLKRRHIDIIHSNTGVIHFGAQVASKLSIPHVWHIREYQTVGLNYKILGGLEHLKKELSNSNNHVIAITKGIFDFFHLKENKDIVIYDGVFKTTDNIRISKQKENYFLFVGDLIRGKGIFSALMAFEEIAKKNPGVEFWIVGNTNADFAKRLEKSPFKFRIRMFGFCSHVKVYDLMYNAKALLVPSYFEGFGFIVVEAMLNGCIVIGRNEAGVKEQFDNGLKYTGIEIGLRFESQAELISRMQYVCDTSFDNFIPMIKAAQNVIQKYTVSQNVDQIICFYDSVVK